MTNRQGFTLIELMVSISIIAILTALATISFTSAQKKARDSRRAQDMKNLQLAAEQYVSQSGGVYPGTTVVPWVIGGQTILEVLPFEPKTGYTPYSLNVGTSSYCICAFMENTISGNASNSTCTLTGGTGPYFCSKNQQ